MPRTIIIERWSLARRLLPADVYVAAKAVLLGAIAIHLARLVWAIVTPVGPLGEWRPAQARILPLPARAVLLGAVDPFFRNVSAAVETLPALDLRLFGVREDRGPGGGAAIIGSPEGDQRSVGVGEEIVPGARLYAVAFDYVVIDRGGRQEKLFLDQSKPAELVAGAAVAGGAVEPAAGPAQLTPDMVRQALILAPRSIGGRVSGATVSSGPDRKMFAATGLQAGDVIVAVNGARFTSAADLAQLQSGLVGGARLSLTVERGAQTVPIALNLAGNR